MRAFWMALAAVVGLGCFGEVREEPPTDEELILMARGLPVRYYNSLAELQQCEAQLPLLLRQRLVRIDEQFAGKTLSDPDYLTARWPYMQSCRPVTL